MRAENAPWRILRVGRVLAGGLVLCAIAFPALASVEVQLRISRGPYYVGVPLEIRVHVSGMERSPEPECGGESPQGGVLALTGLVPNVSTSMRIIGGRITRSESVTFVCQYRFTAGRAGRYEFPPFRVTQGATSALTPRHAIDVTAAPLASEIRVRVELPEAPVYIGQRVAIRIEWWLDESLLERVSSYQLQSELFDREDIFRFVDDEPARPGEQTLELVTAKGTLALHAAVERRQDEGTDFLVVSAERTLIPLRDGTIELSPATIHVEEVVRWRRDLFGSRRAAATRSIFSRDEPRRLIVRPAPAAGRPPSFAGAIGRGFSLEVSVDRSVVQVGDPITLELTVRGDGHLDSVGLPDWAATEGLPPDRLRLSEGDLSGEVEGDTKVFHLAVRVIDESLRQIPALAFSWFDPELGEYQTTYSQPIAVSVKPARVVGPGDVLATHAPDTSALIGADTPPTATPGERWGGRGLSGADLSIERRTALLIRERARRTTLHTVAYTGSIALLAASVWARRRRDAQHAALGCSDRHGG